MEKKTKAGNRPKNDKEWRESLAQKFVEALQTDGLHWKKGWMCLGAPINGGTKRAYHGINAFVLSLIASMNGWGRRWYTFNQISDPKGYLHKNQEWKLQKGSKATYVEYWYPYDTVQKKMITWAEHKQLLKNGRDEEEFLIRATFTAVFNESQIDGVPKEALPESDLTEVADIILKMAENMSLDIQYDGGDQAYYRPSNDTLHLPDPKRFHSQMELNATALHELAHATGHVTRLNRNIKNCFGSDAYAYEELVAEMTSCFMSIRLPELEDEECLKNHQAYVKSWISGLQDQPKILSDAIRDAMAAAGYLDEMAGIHAEGSDKDQAENAA